MRYVKKSERSLFDDMKSDIHKGYMYFKANFQRYHDFITFIYQTSLSPADTSVLRELQKPTTEFNILEAYLSRLLGEFSKMDPVFNVRATEGVNLIDPRIVPLVEAHMKAAFQNGDTNHLSYQIYKDLLSGGFSVAKVYTEYAHEKSFDQKICVERVFDPTLTVFDYLARKSHKGDGRFCAELFPKSVGEAEELYGSDILKDVNFARSPNLKDFNWSYKNQQEDIILFAEYYRKKYHKAKILKLANGHVVTEKAYEQFLEHWQNEGMIEQPPIVLKSRKTEIVTIDKYTLTESKIVDHQPTNFTYLPLVFFDGNSAMIRDNDQAEAGQMTRPYVYHARDAQKMKNFAGQSLCNEIENMVMHKWVAPVEGIPDNVDYQLAYTNPQKASILLYNQYLDDDPNKPINPPREINRTPIPPEITTTFNLADQTVQAILGSYDAAIGVNENDISGIAIMQGAMHSNAAAMPYTNGFIAGWGRLGEIYLDLLPKYYVTPRTIPVIKPDGTRDYYDINKQGNVSFNYDTSALEVNVTPGVNFNVQKQIALKTIVALMQASEQFAKFVNDEGLEILLDNIDIKGIDNLKVKAKAWNEKQKQLQQQAMQQAANQPTEAQLAQAQIQVQQAAIQQKAEQAQLNAQVDMAKNASESAVQNKEADIKFVEVMSKISNADLERELKQQELDSEDARTAVEMATKVSEHINDLKDSEHERQK